MTARIYANENNKYMFAMLIMGEINTCLTFYSYFLTTTANSVLPALISWTVLAKTNTATDT